MKSGASGMWPTYVEEIPGVNTQGNTLKEARENLQEALKLILEVKNPDSTKIDEKVAED